jgi:hypothetical protein
MRGDSPAIATAGRARAHRIAAQPLSIGFTDGKSRAAKCLSAKQIGHARVPRNLTRDLAVVSIGEGSDIRFDERLKRSLPDMNHDLLLVDNHEQHAADRARSH